MIKESINHALTVYERYYFLLHEDYKVNNEEYNINSNR